MAGALEALATILQPTHDDPVSQRMQEIGTKSYPVKEGGLGIEPCTSRLILAGWVAPERGGAAGGGGGRGRGSSRGGGRGRGRGGGDRPAPY